MAEKEPGFVYILTNPSFREDWVKIGMSSRPVEMRLKELDNTSVPLPFDIYATMRTTKYVQAEKHIHHYIERFTNFRIRDTREFFNIKPEVALDIFREVKTLLDDAEIFEYHNGEPIAQMKGDSPGQEEPHSSSSTQFRKQKDIFWNGYNSYMARQNVYTENFPVKATIPSYSLDLPLGTSLCNLYQVVKKAGVCVGIYFHGKDLFNALIPARADIDAFVGEPVIWEEYNKDCSIACCMDCNIVEMSNYDEIYGWMLKKAVALKKALYTFFDGKQVNSNEVKRAAPFRFSMVDIPVGAELVFTPANIRVMVANDRQIEYQGKLFSMSAFTAEYMPVDRRNASGAYCGPEHFSFEGEALSALRLKKECVSNSNVE